MYIFFRTKALLLAVILLLAFLSCERSSLKSQVNTSAEGLAIKGYDPVAYFTGMKPTMGRPEFKYVWKGAEWRFDSSDHLEMFKKNPEKYAPRYYRNIDYRGIAYKGNTIGYLFTYRYSSFSRDSIEINLFERGGKVYFSVLEKNRD